MLLIKLRYNHIRANQIDILSDGGHLIAQHSRVYGDKRSDVSDYKTTLATLLKNSGAWFNSGFRQNMPDFGIQDL